MKKYLFIVTIILQASFSYSQDDLMDLLDDEPEEPVITTATFKGGRLINGHTVETRARKQLEFLISHRFGRVNAGGDELFGLDDAFIRLGLEYGVLDRLSIGIGRSSVDKTFDGYAKWKLISQSSTVPLSVVYFTSAAYKSLKNQEGFDTYASKMAYVHQLLLARKFSPSFSFQFMPSVVHRNRVGESQGENDLYALGAGGRMKISKRVSFNAEYYYRLNAPDNDNLFNSVAVGFDIETGGHVFQLHFTNSRGMIERAFIADTNGYFWDGDVHFGFNISRVF